jgi:hypothetical protein
MTVAVREEHNFDMILQDVETMQRMCSALMKTKHYQKMGEDGVFAIVQKAKSLGISPLEALNGGLYYVQGKTGMSSEMMASLIRQKGHSVIKDDRSNDKICILKGKRADNGDTWTISFSMEDARRAGLAKNMYDKYPAIMLYNRAMSMLARQLFPDVIKGAGYTMDELKEISESKHIPFKPEPIKSESLEYAAFEVSTVVSEDDANLLQEYFDGCSSDYQEKFNEWMSKTLGINSITKLNSQDYERVERVLKTKYEENKKSQDNQELEHATG